MQYSKDIKKLLVIYLVFFLAVMFSLAVNQQLLSQYNPVFFNHNHDLTELIIIITGLPSYMIMHPPLFLVADISIVLCLIVLVSYYLKRGTFSPLAGIFFSCAVGLYITMLNIFAQFHSEMLMGLFIISFCFITNNEARFYTLIALCRYFLLYVFVSAAAWKICRGNFTEIDHFSNVLITQHADILSNNCDSFLCRFYYYLIDHRYVSYSIYVVSIILEASFLIGFFTTKYDKWLLTLAVLFFTADYFIMRISYWPFMILGITLLLRRELTVSCKKS